ncbi:MAG: hypothetical protein AB1611_11900 [bacterium]
MKTEEKKKHFDNNDQSLSTYEPPTMITYSEQELLEEMEGMSVQACSGFAGSVIC